MTTFDLPEDMKPPEECDAYEKVKNPWSNTSYGKSDYYWRKIPESRRRSNYRREDCPQKIKDRVKQRDGENCRNCGTNSNLEVHHIVPVKVNGEHKMGNLATLCRKCHEKVPHPHTGESECEASQHSKYNSAIISAAGKKYQSETCDNCDREGKLHKNIEPHFIIPLAEGGCAEDSNTAYLCEVCHSAAHGKRECSRTPHTKLY